MASTRPPLVIHGIGIDAIPTGPGFLPFNQDVPAPEVVAGQRTISAPGSTVGSLRDGVDSRVLPYAPTADGRTLPNQIGPYAVLVPTPSNQPVVTVALPAEVAQLLAANPPLGNAIALMNALLGRIDTWSKSGSIQCGQIALAFYRLLGAVQRGFMLPWQGALYSPSALTVGAASIVVVASAGFALNQIGVGSGLIINDGAYSERIQVTAYTLGPGGAYATLTIAPALAYPHPYTVIITAISPLTAETHIYLAQLKTLLMQSYLLFTARANEATALAGSPLVQSGAQAAMTYATALDINAQGTPALGYVMAQMNAIAQGILLP